MAGKMRFFNPRSYELIIYIALWGVVWAYPLLAIVVIALNGDKDVVWESVLHDWTGIFPFFLLFLLHRLPVHFLFMRHRVRPYILSVAALLCLFGAGCYSSETGTSAGIVHQQEQRMMPEQQLLDNKPLYGGDDAGPYGEGPMKHSAYALIPPRHNGHRPTPGRPPFKPMMLELVIATLMLGFDLAIAIFFRYQEQLERARLLETEHLRYQLEHLKAQVNPHFFMNMLHSIHGLVELKPDKAQVMIMELSQLMRYVLYEGDKPLTTLSKEAEFLTNYVELMRKRYSSRKVRISLELPDESGERIFLPPLLFINIIENAFKHGISYIDQSFVIIRLFVEGNKLHLNCTNSDHRRSAGSGNDGGVGLANLRQRLQLLYDKDFTLEITAVEEMAYQVELIIPYE